MEESVLKSPFKRWFHIYPLLPQTEADFRNWLKDFHLIQVTHFSSVVIALWLRSNTENCVCSEAGKVNLSRLNPKYKLIEDISLLCMCLFLSIFLQRYIAFMFKKSCQKQNIKNTVLLVLWLEWKMFPIHSCIWTVAAASSADDWCSSGGSSALSEEVCLWGWALKFYTLAPLPAFLFSATWVWMKRSLYFLTTRLTLRLLLPSLPSHDWLYSLWNCKPK